MTLSKEIAILVPCYNEEMTIGQVIADFQRVLPDAKIYVYDNNSIDNTAEVAKKTGAIVRSETRQGKGNVIRRMFREIDADCYLLVDGDCTYPADTASEMSERILSGEADMVVGDRLSSTYFQENKRPFHNVGNRLVRWLICKFWHTQIHDVMSGYRAFSRRFVKMFPVMSEGFEIETEMTIHALDRRFDILEIPIQYQDRPSGSSSKLNTYKDGMRVLKTIFVLFEEYRPLLFFGLLSLLLALVAVILFIPVFIEYCRIGLVPRFPTLFVSLFLGLASLISLFTGFCLNVIVKKSRKEYELQLLNYEKK
ncbi:MAG: glycosyltransferase [Bacteroidales bacterium]|nr:glycosyltransferase [Bacteroidales bacterium]